MTKGFYHKEWYAWRDEVLRHVRFTPDHEAIAKELFAHYEDSVLDFERIGYSEELARERALAAMGEAEEVGKGLDHAHKPWLGWLLMATKWMMVGLAICLAVTLVGGWTLGEIFDHLEDQLQWQTPPAEAVSADTGHGTIHIAPGTVWEEEGRICQRMDLWLAMDVPQASRPEVWQALRFTTDRGEVTRYETGADAPYYDLQSDADFYAMDGYTRYQVSVRFVTREPLEWVEVRPLIGNWMLRTEWEVEE